jgi:hypothetical protein
MALRVEGGRRYGAMNAAARGISEMVLGCLGTVRRVGREEKEREREREKERTRTGRRNDERGSERGERILLFEGCPGSSGLLRGVLHYLWPPSIIVRRAQDGVANTPLIAI